MYLVKEMLFLFNNIVVIVGFFGLDFLEDMRGVRGLFIFLF